MYKLFISIIGLLLLTACQPLTSKSQITKSNSRPSDSINQGLNNINRGIPDRRPDIPRY